jgi:hypothetical protein
MYNYEYRLIVQLAPKRNTNFPQINASFHANQLIRLPLLQKITFKHQDFPISLSFLRFPKLYVSLIHMIVTTLIVTTLIVTTLIVPTLIFINVGNMILL